MTPTYKENIAGKLLIGPERIASTT